MVEGEEEFEELKEYESEEQEKGTEDDEVE